MVVLEVPIKYVDDRVITEISINFQDAQRELTPQYMMGS